MRNRDNLGKETKEVSVGRHPPPRFLLALPAVALLLAKCGGGGETTSESATTTSSELATTTSSGSAAATAVQVSTGSLPGLGTVLVNGEGRTLYMFEPDKRSEVTCVGECAAVWPPLKVGNAAVTAAGEANASLLGTAPNPDGGQVVTYAGWPLYTYVGDSFRGTANGQALNLNGGLWYVLAPSGEVIEKEP